MDMFLTSVRNNLHTTDTTQLLNYLYSEGSAQLVEPHARYYTRVVNNVEVLPLGYQDKLDRILDTIRAFKANHPEDTWYSTFYVPKATGGLREINAPCQELKDIQRQILTAFQYCASLRILPHDAAYAYEQHRSTVEMMQVHQSNDSQWFIHLDIKDFFPSCKTETVKSLLRKVFPFALIPPETLDELLSVCVHEGALPQGGVTSPFLTNMMFVSVDHEINKQLWNHQQYRHIYTRYADDMVISTRYKGKLQEYIDLVQNILTPYGFQLKPAKCRMGSRAGRNWNVGLMLNKDNKITLGHEKKQRLRAAVWCFLKDFKDLNAWGAERTQHLVGILSYAYKVEPMFRDGLIRKYETKARASFKEAVRFHLNGELPID